MPQIDYFERAKRLEEIPLIKKAYEEQRVKDMELWELQEEERVRWKRNKDLLAHVMHNLWSRIQVFAQVLQTAIPLLVEQSNLAVSTF